MREYKCVYVCVCVSVCLGMCVSVCVCVCVCLGDCGSPDRSCVGLCFTLRFLADLFYIGS